MTLMTNTKSSTKMTSAWTSSPQEVDPLSWFAGPGLPTVFAGAAVAQGLAITIVYWASWSSVPLQFVAMAFYVLAGLLTSRFTLPNQPQLGTRRVAIVLLVASIGLVASSIGTANGTVPLQQWWPGIALGATLASLAPYSSARRMITYSIAVLVVVIVDGTLLFSNIPSFFPPAGTVVIAGGPVAVAAFASIVFCHTVVARTRAFLETSARDEDSYVSSGPLDDSEAQERMARASARVGPFIERIADVGVITSADRALAAQIARTLRSELVSVADRSWLDALAEQMTMVVSDPARLADAMNESQRVALRALLVAAHGSSVVDQGTILLELRAQDDGSTAVALSLDLDLPEGRRLRLLAPYYLTLKTTVDDLSWADGPSTQLNFRIPPNS
jgi:hypothetical protein